MTSSGQDADHTTSLSIDDDDRIVAVNEGWDEFALANEGQAITADRIVGEDLFRYIHGDPAQMFVRVLLERARAGGDPIDREYRCDSPQLRRFMSMRVRPHGRLVVFEHRLLRAEPRPQPLRFSVSTAAGLRRCSICARLLVDGTWQEPDAAAKLGVIEPQSYVIYGVCPRCRLPQPASRPSWSHG